MAPAEPRRLVAEPAHGVVVRGCLIAGPVRDLGLPQQGWTRQRADWLRTAAMVGVGAIDPRPEQRGVRGPSVRSSGRTPARSSIQLVWWLTKALASEPGHITPCSD
jgi:hypothetical protein